MILVVGFFKISLIIFSVAPGWCDAGDKQHVGAVSVEFEPLIYVFLQDTEGRNGARYPNLGCFSSASSDTFEIGDRILQPIFNICSRPPVQLGHRLVNIRAALGRVIFG